DDQHHYHPQSFHCATLVLDEPRSDESFFLHPYGPPRHLHSFPTRRSSDLMDVIEPVGKGELGADMIQQVNGQLGQPAGIILWERSEEHTSELQSRENLVCRLLLEKKKRPSAKTPRATTGKVSASAAAGITI